MAIRKDEVVRLSGSKEYADYILRARKRFEQGRAATVEELRKVYRRTASEIRKEIEDLTPGSLTRAHQAALAANLERRARELNQRILDLAHKGIYMSTETGTMASEQIGEDLLEDAWPRTEVARLFAPVNERATLAILARTGKDGLKLSDRVWRIGEKYRNAVTRVVEDGVARGLNSRVLAKQVQQYLEPGKWTAMKQETRRRLGVSKDVSYEAMRLARTEMNNAFHESSIAANSANPGYKGIYWVLSSSHPVRDICDDMAAHNGDGFYPKGEEPVLPHPACLCAGIPSYEDPSEFADRLNEWMRDPASQPDMEKWYQSTGREVFQRPNPIGTLFQGVSNLFTQVRSSVLDLQLFSKELPLQRIERLVREGRMPQESVSAAERLWRENLRGGVSLPTGESVTVTLDDLYHAIVDPMIWRRPERIEQILSGTFEIRTTDKEGRRIALSRWSEDDKERVGYAILKPDSGLQAVHVADEKKIRREQRKGEVLWSK